MAKRTGVTTIHIVARRLCQLLTKYGPVIKLLYPSNTALAAALDAASAACQTLVEEVAAVRIYGD